MESKQDAGEELTPDARRACEAELSAINALHDQDMAEAGEWFRGKEPFDLLAFWERINNCMLEAVARRDADPTPGNVRTELIFRFARLGLQAVMSAEMAKELEAMGDGQG